MLEKTPKREALFWSKVDKTSGCWNWTAYVGTHGYGVIGTMLKGENRTYHTHRVSWEWHNGPIPAGVSVLHRCDNRKCVNPSHLFLGTHRDNMQDMTAKGRHVGNRKLTEAQVINIRERRAAGERTKDLGAEFGMSPQHISSICVGKFWPYTPGPRTITRKDKRSA